MSESSSQLIGVGELFKVSWQTLKERWKTLLAIDLVSWLIIMVAVVIAGGLAFAVPPLMPLAVGAMVVVILVMASALTAAEIRAVSSEDGYSASFQFARPMLWGLLGLLVVIGLITFSGLVLFIIPGIIFALWFSQAVYVFVLEKTTLGEALGRSRQLVTGRMMAVLGRYVALAVVVVVVTMVIDMIFPSATTSMPADPANLEAALEALSRGNEATNPMASALNAVFSLFMSMYGAAYGYHLYKSLVATEKPEAE